MQNVYLVNRYLLFIRFLRVKQVGLEGYKFYFYK
jgi:hypothetical protein